MEAMLWQRERTAELRRAQQLFERTVAPLILGLRTHWDDNVESEASAVIDEATENGKLITNDAWNKKQWKETKKPINSARIEHLGNLPREEREKVGVAITTATSKLMIEHSHRCMECAMKKKLCVCDELRSMRPTGEERRYLNFDIAVYMHAKERYRASNTGKVLEKLYDAKIYVDSVEEDMIALQEAIDARKSRCCVLFPSNDSKTVEELRSESVLYRPSDPAVEGERVLIILVDGTWKQAKRLQKRIDRSVPRIRLMPTTLSRFMCRTQSQADRVCTVEAAALLMSEMGYPAEEYRLLQGLEAVVRAFNLQTFGTPYLRSVGEVLKLGEASSGEPLADVTANLPMIAAVLEELKGQEGLLLQDQTGSKHLQRLVRFLKNNNLGEELVDLCSRLLEKTDMYYDQYGSHVVQEAVACLVAQLDNEQVWSMLKTLVKYIIENFSDMVWDACATHIIRSLALTLAGYVQPSTSSNKKKKKKQQQQNAAASGRDTALTLPSHKLEKGAPTYCSKLIAKLCGCLDSVETGDESQQQQQLSELCEHPSSSVTIQLLATVGSPSEGVFKSILGDADSIRRLMSSGPGSRSLEVFIARCATEQPTVFHSGVMGFVKDLGGEEMDNLYEGGFGLYVLQAVVWEGIAGPFMLCGGPVIVGLSILGNIVTQIISSVREPPHLHELLSKEGLIESLVAKAATSPPHLATLQNRTGAIAFHCLQLIDDSNSPIQQGQRMQFIRALVKHDGLIEKLATQPSAGSWVLAKMWESSIADAAVRKTMAERLVKIEEDIKEKNMVLWKRLGLHEFKVANEEWEEKMQKQSQARELFDDILNLDTSTAGSKKTDKKRTADEQSDGEDEEEKNDEEADKTKISEKEQGEGAADLADALALLGKKRKGGKSKAPRKKKRQQ
ncbi:hypothetical protein FOZ60_013195 [Perkinsus olseni]|uniref:tRNA-uridine aminocarboxypropyltransferase n=1 Tax=Perkinsus olseni TaxID=32597 RepID=A0A7J6P8U1_PEROL|nr:hypothetical protein FOZ60_013195 [Perkinsus olseni]